jgi:hypothetical protein
MAETDSRSARRGGRVPPHDLQAEDSLLGAMMLEPDAIAAAAGLRADDFYKPAHSYIFDAVHALYASGELIARPDPPAPTRGREAAFVSHPSAILGNHIDVVPSAACALRSQQLDTTRTISTAVVPDPTLPLYVHVGGARDTGKAAVSYDLGTLIWRGATGAERIAEFGADPVTGADAFLDFATYEHRRFGRDGAIATALRGSRMAMSFAPGYFADHREPVVLDRWLDEVHATQAAIRSAGVGGDLVPVVALTYHWLTKPKFLTRAARAVSRFDGAVGIVLASANNPLAAPEQIRGAADLFRSAGNVMALRCDEAAIGLLAQGARLASVGSTSTTRHLFYGRPSSKPKRRPGHEVFHPRTMSWIKHYQLDLFAVPTEDLLCSCAVCKGRSILRFADPGLAPDVLAHSILCLQALAADVINAPDPVARWHQECASAADAADRLNRLVPQFNLGRSARAWRSALLPSL